MNKLAQGDMSPSIPVAHVMILDMNVSQKKSENNI